MVRLGSHDCQSAGVCVVTRWMIQDHARHRVERERRDESSLFGGCF